MAIYCSEECRNEDELRSRLSFANLTEERERSLSSAPMHAAHSSNGGGTRTYSASSLSPTFGPVPSASAFRQLVESRTNNVNSPWCNDSEGSEFEWHHQHHHHSHSHKESHHAHTSASRHRASLSRDSSDIVATSGSEGRRYSDASDSSRLSVYGRPPALHHPHARRSSSRTRGSTDSLASMGSAGYEPYSSSGGSAGLARPDIGHRSNSALSGGLRAMTPIHQQPATSTSASPRMTSPGRTASNSKAAAPSPQLNQPSKRESLPAPSPSSGVTASILIPSDNAAATSGSAEAGPESLNLASSTFIAPSSAKTFRPASVSRSSNGSSFLKPSKSSATLALSAGEDVRATMVAERTTSQSPVRKPANAMSRAQQRRSSHHASTSSIPYLSCSPSSPGSGSMNSGRSNVSTDPSSSGRVDGEYCDDYESDDGEYVPLPRKQEDERHSNISLSNYGLFYQRTPSTPCLPSLANPSSYGRSPSFHSFDTRNSRLSSSYDTKDAGSTTISSVFRERQNRPPMSSHTSSSLRMTPTNGVASSPRRAPFDINAAYQQGPPRRNQSSSKLHPPYSGHAQPDNTPTQSGLTSRSQSFVGHYGRMVEEPVHEVVQEVAKDEHGRTRAPSITRTDLERVASDRSLSSGNVRARDGTETSRSSSSTIQRLPSHLRPAVLSPRHSNEVLPSPPVSPGLYARNGSNTAIHQLVNDDSAAHSRPLLASGRSKSRSSFTWDHLPPYIPQYAALDLDKVRRNKSGTSLHSVYEDENENNQSMPSSQQSTVKSIPQNHSSRKRLFYFPGADEI